MQQLKRGILISVEGIDGSGKSTVARSLAHHFQQQNYCVLLTREPGATPLGAQLRRLVQEKTHPMCSKAEFLLFASDRAQHFHELVIPALDQKKLVISDRLSDSSLAYQGYGRGLDTQQLRMINEFAMNGVQADITLYIRVSVDTAYERIRSRNQALTSFEKETKEFMKAVVRGFDSIAKNKETYHIIDGEQSPEYVSTAAITYIESWIRINQLLLLP